MNDPVPAWQELLDALRRQAEESASPEAETAEFAAIWLATRDELSLSPPPRRDETDGGFEPYLALLRLFGRLDRGLSDMLYRRAYDELPPLLGSDFGDWAVGSLARETYLDIRMAGWAFYNGLDLQAMSLLRQMAELSWRAMIVAGEPSVADEWWQSIVASAEGGERAKLEKRLWQRHFRPAAMLRHVSQIEAHIDGLHGTEAQKAEHETIVRKSALYSLLSGTTHGGTELVYASVVRGGGTRLPEDPFASIGHPTDLGRDLVTAGLSLQARFWRYFPLVAFPDVPGAPGEADTPEAALALTARAVSRLLETRYAEYVGI